MENQQILQGEAEAPAHAQAPASLSGFKVLLMGPAGTGKTYSLGTLVESELEVFYLNLENGFESLLGYWRDKGQHVPSNLHWHKVAPPKADFLTLAASAKRINTLPLDTLAKAIDPDRKKHDYFVSILNALNDFPDDRTGERFGNVLQWKPDRVLAIDGLTGIANSAMSLVIGGKAVRSQSDWGIAQGQVLKLLQYLCDGTDAHVAVLAHVERETDAVLGGVKLMVSSLGKALSPVLPSLFSDVILAVRTGSTWTWDTASAQADVKTRNLPISASNKPDFRPILQKWRNRAAFTDE